MLKASSFEQGKNSVYKPASQSLFLPRNNQLNCCFIESIFDMSLVYLHMLVQRCCSWQLMLQKFVASNFASSDFRLVT